MPFRLGVWVMLAIATIGISLGCYHDKYNMRPPEREDYTLPPQEKRFNEPEMAPYRKPPPAPEEKTLLGRPPSPKVPPGVGGLGP
ncbi:MAG: hypothetical protein NZ703_03335 [Gemmataceae bacterium]|nr:hypothetical protein [Gemmataceae bacterium]MCS7270097.1 hypothetical protein [Gemmataceae bacterium]MDW8242359.1 hypothetical protein [Thermogemmata sp.]